MLYQLYDLQEALLTPMRLAAGATQITLQHPLVPMAYTRAGRAVAAGAELFERTTRRYRKPEFEITSTMVDGTEVPVREEPVVVKPFCTLTHFRKLSHRPAGDTVLLVAPLSGHWPTLLRGTVEALLPNHDVYITGWQDAKLVPLAFGPFDLSTYVQYLREFLIELGPDVSVIAVCQPAVPVMGAVALMAAEDHPCQPRAMVLMGGPIDTRAAPTAVTRLAESRPLSWFESTVITRVPAYYPGGFRRVYPGFLQLTGFMTMNLDRHIGEHVKLFNHLVQGDGDGADAHRKFYDEYLSVMDLTAEFYLQTVSTVFQKHALPLGTWEVSGQRIDLSRITKTALMTIEGEKDDISAPGQTRAAHDLCTGIPAHRHDAYLQMGVGHYGIFNGRRWREVIRPRITSFLTAMQD